MNCDGLGCTSRTSGVALSDHRDTVCSEWGHWCMVFADWDLWLPCNSCLHIGMGSSILIVLEDELSFTSLTSPSAGVESDLHNCMIRK